MQSSSDLSKTLSFLYEYGARNWDRNVRLFPPMNDKQERLERLLKELDEVIQESNRLIQISQDSLEAGQRLLLVAREIHQGKTLSPNQFHDN